MAKVPNPPPDPAVIEPRCWLSGNAVLSSGTVVTGPNERLVRLLYDDIFVDLTFVDELPDGVREGRFGYTDNVATVTLLNKSSPLGLSWHWHGIATTDDQARLISLNTLIHTVGSEPDKLVRLINYTFAASPNG